MPRRANHLAEAIGACFDVVELGDKGCALVAQPLNLGPPCGCCRRESEFGGAVCKPFDFLQLDAIPRWVANDRIKAAFRADICPLMPDARECDFPMQEAFLVGNLSGLVPQSGKLRPGGRIGIGRCVAQVFWTSGEKLVRIRHLSADCRD